MMLFNAASTNPSPPQMATLAAYPTSQHYPTAYLTAAHQPQYFSASASQVLTTNGPTTLNNQIIVQIPYQFSQPQPQYVQIQPQLSPVQYVDQYGQPVEFGFSTVQVSATTTTTAAVPPAPKTASAVVDKPKSCPLNQPASLSSPGISKKQRHGRQRFAFAHELQYKGPYETGTGPFSRIRVWVNDRNLHYYDCECGKRKPVQDLYKIKQHALRHEIEQHLCDVCGKVFKHHLQMNAHMRVHKKDCSGSPSRSEDAVKHEASKIEEAVKRTNAQ